MYDERYQSYTSDPVHTRHLVYDLVLKDGVPHIILNAEMSEENNNNKKSV